METGSRGSWKQGGASFGSARRPPRLPVPLLVLRSSGRKLHPSKSHKCFKDVRCHSFHKNVLFYQGCWEEEMLVSQGCPVKTVLQAWGVQAGETSTDKAMCLVLQKSGDVS